MDSKTSHNITNSPAVPVKTDTPRRICTGPAQMGLMHRFIKNRAHNLIDSNNNIDEKSSPIKRDCEKKLRYHVSIFSPKPNTVTYPDLPPIDRDENGNPIRRGYIPAKIKIQTELTDYRNREAELRKRNRRCYSLGSHPDLITSIRSDPLYFDEKFTEEECERILKSTPAPSISEMNDSISSVFSDLSEIASPNSSFNYHQIHRLPQRRSFPLTSTTQNLFIGDMYIESEEDEPLSSKKLIAKWENIIKESTKK